MPSSAEGLDLWCSKTAGVGTGALPTLFWGSWDQGLKIVAPGVDVAYVSNAEIITGFIISTVGFSIFLYGKKQKRPPQLIAGIALMAAPFAVPNPLWDSVASVGVVLAMRVAILRGM